jgi:DNA anti-recombination protein RmuC
MMTNWWDAPWKWNPERRQPQNNALEEIGKRLKDLREHVSVIKGELEAIEQGLDEQLNSLAKVVEPGSLKK